MAIQQRTRFEIILLHFPLLLLCRFPLLKFFTLWHATISWIALNKWIFCGCDAWCDDKVATRSSHFEWFELLFSVSVDIEESKYWFQMRNRFRSFASHDKRFYFSFFNFFSMFSLSSERCQPSTGGFYATVNEQKKYRRCFNFVKCIASDNNEYEMCLSAVLCPGTEWFCHCLLWSVIFQIIILHRIYLTEPFLIYGCLMPLLLTA